MSIETAPDYSLWGLPQAMPTFLLTEPIDRLTEDEVPIQEILDSEWVEYMAAQATVTRAETRP